MKSGYAALFIVSMWVFFLLPTGLVAGNYDDFPVVVHADQQKNPAISGDIVVWQDKRAGNWDIHYRNLDTDINYVATNATGDQKNPDICGDIIVWEDAGDVYGYRISTETAFTVCDDANPQANPAVGPTAIVWDENGDIYGCYISDLIKFPVCTDAGSQLYPDVDGVTVVWLDTRNTSTSGYDIYARELSGGGVYPLCTAPNGQLFPRIDGQTAAWQDERNKAVSGDDIYGYNLTTDSELVICTFEGNQTSAEVGSGFVVWQSEGADGFYDVYAKDVSGGSEQLVRADTGSGGALPAVDGEVVVWQDERHYETTPDIYGGRRPRPSTIELISPNGGEMILAGHEYLVEWTSSIMPDGSVMIEYSTNNGGSYVTEQASVPNTGAWLWKPVAVEDSNQCLLRISDPAYPAAADTSDSVFTIYPCNTTGLGADLTGDCIVNMADIAEIAANWLACGNPYDPRCD